MLQLLLISHLNGKHKLQMLKTFLSLILFLVLQPQEIHKLLNILTYLILPLAKTI